MLSPSALEEIARSVETLQRERESYLERLNYLEGVIAQLNALRERVSYEELPIMHPHQTKYVSSSKILSTSIIDATREFLDKKGRPCTTREIFDGLHEGNFRFPETWSERHQFRNLAITLSKNSESLLQIRENVYWLADRPLPLNWQNNYFSEAASAATSGAISLNPSHYLGVQRSEVSHLSNIFTSTPKSIFSRDSSLDNIINLFSRSNSEKS